LTSTTENLKKIIQDTGIGNDFLNRTPKDEVIIEKSEQSGCIQL
jgi:hypothetical protein